MTDAPQTLLAFRAVLAALPVADADALTAAATRNGVLTKPLGALGQLEQV
ncbi:MAG: nicotinate-nucleotide--dimethylbenzimidazole phosphoribosyltransferase, partial [Candidatus Saccharibacteria bacterium]|nr:nicotinate-nucleotide--dimethylbenzimidazole phosphoribosyltransferase [Pseudorhodobacter sp.]